MSPCSDSCLKGTRAQTKKQAAKGQEDIDGSPDGDVSES